MPQLTDPRAAASLLALGNDLARSVTSVDICAALGNRLPAISGADRVLVLRRTAHRTSDQHQFTVVASSHPEDRAIVFHAVSPLTGSRAVQRRAGAGQDSVYTDMYRCLPSPMQTVAHTSMGLDHLILMGWSHERALDDEDWTILESVARQASAALERVDALRRVQELSLEDPETGLGNRRLVEVVLERSFARSTRGEPLTVVSIRPGAAAAADSSRIAEWLRAKARGSDVAAYLEEGVYVVVLHASSAEGAGIFLRRILASIGEPEVICAVAEQDGRFATPDALLKDVLNRVGIDANMN